MAQLMPDDIAQDFGRRDDQASVGEIGADQVGGKLLQISSTSRSMRLSQIAVQHLAEESRIGHACVARATTHAGESVLDGAVIRGR